MNKYVAGTEKERLIRLFLFHRLLILSIDEYAEFNTNKRFVGNLKRSKYFLKSALDQRLESLDTDAEINFIKSINKVGFAFLPKAEAKRELEATKKLGSVIPMDRDDFQDWVEFMIESACKTCKRGDFTECQGRKVMVKNDITPWMPDAVGCCQYSYVDVVK